MLARISAQRARFPPPTSAVAQPVKRISARAFRTSGQSTSPAPILEKPAFTPQFYDTVAQGADPFRGLAVSLVVADVEVGSNPRTVDFVDVLHQFPGGLIVGAIVVVEEAVPDVFVENVNPQSGGEGQGLADLPDGSLPGLLLGGPGINHGRDQKNGSAADGITLPNGGEQSLESLLPHFGRRIGESGAPVDRVDHAVGGQTDFFGSLPRFVLVLSSGGVEFHPIVAKVLQEAELLLQSLPLATHPALQRQQDGMVLSALVMIGGGTEQAGRGGEGSGGEEAAAGWRLHGLTRTRGEPYCKP